MEGRGGGRGHLRPDDPMGVDRIEQLMGEEGRRRKRGGISQEGRTRRSGALSALVRNIWVI